MDLSATDVKPEQYSKAPYPIEVTEFGMVMLVKPDQDLNAEASMDCSDWGRVMLLRLK